MPLKVLFCKNIENLYGVMPIIWTPTTTFTFDKTLQLFDNQVSYSEKLLTNATFTKCCCIIGEEYQIQPAVSR